MKVRTYEISGRRNGEAVVEYVKGTAKKAQSRVQALNAAGAVVSMRKVFRKSELKTLEV